MNMMQGFFSSANPFLVRLWDFFQTSRVKLKPYSFTAEWNPLAASAVGTQPTTPITIDPQIDFLLLQMNFVAYSTTGDQNTARPTPNMLLSISEKSGANIFTDTDHHVALWTGNSLNGAQSYTLPFPRLIVGNNAILAKLTDNGGSASRCFLGFEGMRIEYINTSHEEVFPSG